MVTIAKGFTFSHGVLDQMSYTALHALVDSATVTNLVMSEFSSSSHLVQVSATTPSSDQGDGSFWYDSTLGILRSKNANARWDCPYVGPEMACATGTIRKGEWVTVTGDGTVAACLTGMWPDVLGLAVSTAVSGGKLIVRQKGLGECLVIGPVTIGNVAISAGTGVFAFGTGSVGVLGFGFGAATAGEVAGETTPPPTASTRPAAAAQRVRRTRARTCWSAGRA